MIGSESSVYRYSPTKQEPPWSEVTWNETVRNDASNAAARNSLKISRVEAFFFSFVTVAVLI